MNECKFLNATVKNKKEVNLTWVRSFNRPEAIANAIGGLFDVVGIAGWIIGGFSILVGGFGIANIMFVSVKERTSIIGLQKSFGGKKLFYPFLIFVRSSIPELNCRTCRNFSGLPSYFLAFRKPGGDTQYKEYCPVVRSVQRHWPHRGYCSCACAVGLSDSR